MINFSDMMYQQLIAEIQASGCIAADAGGSVHAVDTTAFVLERCGKLRALCMLMETGWDWSVKPYLKKISTPHGHTHRLYRPIQYCIIKSVAGAGTKDGGYTDKKTQEKRGPVNVKDLTMFSFHKGTPYFTGIKVRRSRVEF